MRRLLAGLFLFVILWQLVGVTSWFELSRRAVRKEIKTLIKQGVPDHQLIHFTFDNAQVEQLHWINNHEFELQGKLYDVVRSFKVKSGRQVIMHCIDDVKEKTLFAQLGLWTARDLGTENHPTPLFFCIKLLSMPMVLNHSIANVTILNEDLLKDSTFNYSSPPYLVYLDKYSPPPVC